MQDPENEKGQIKRLLIIACSARKHQQEGLLPAWDVYDGVTYQVLKRLQRESNCLSDVDVLILSARYGLIKPSTLIECYNAKMQLNIAARQACDNVAALKTLWESRTYREVFINVGKVYLEALQPIPYWLKQATLVLPRGGIGQKNSQMRKWLLTSVTQRSTANTRLIRVPN